jgi:acetyl-CoA carboxylase biotin carboxyl carrier protein
MSDTDSDGKAAKAPEATIDTRLVRDLARILKDTGLSEIEVERGDLRIRVARELTITAAPQTYAHVAAAPALAASVAAAAAPAGVAAPKPAANGDTVKSPMVGTVYLQSQPGADPFMKVGDKVAQGQTLLIIEAMKTMNPIPAPKAGTVVEVLVADGQPVEFGEPLAVIE